MEHFEKIQLCAKKQKQAAGKNLNASQNLSSAFVCGLSGADKKFMYSLTIKSCIMETVVKKNGKATQNDVAIVSKTGIAIDKVKTETAVAEVKQPEPVQEIAPVQPVKQFESLTVTPPKPVLTLEQKIEKVETLKTLIEKRERLEASRKKLTAFVVGANQFSENIVLTDENGNTFKTSNTEVFAKVVDTIQNTLVSKIAEIENQIEF